MKIMIVDDHSEMRQVLKKMVLLSVSGQHDFIECANGEEAIAKYGDFQPDCVLMDFEMGAMNGLEASKIIYSRDLNAKVVIVTGYDTPTLRKKAKELQLLGFVTKDNLQEIHSILRNILQG